MQCTSWRFRCTMPSPNQLIALNLIHCTTHLQHCQHTPLLVRTFEMTVDSSAGLHSLPVSQRPPTSLKQKLRAVAFFITFNLCCLTLNASQFVFLLPLRLLPFQWSRSLYEEGIQYTKGSFGCLLSMSAVTTYQTIG